MNPSRVRHVSWWRVGLGLLVLIGGSAILDSAILTEGASLQSSCQAMRPNGSVLSRHCRRHCCSPIARFRWCATRLAQVSSRARFQRAVLGCIDIYGAQRREPFFSVRGRGATHTGCLLATIDEEMRENGPSLRVAVKIPAILHCRPEGGPAHSLRPPLVWAGFSSQRCAPVYVDTP